jgi:hypothetical protein
MFVIHGLGVWRYDKDTGENDTKLLESMFDFGFRKGQAPYSLQSLPSPMNGSTKTVHLHNLAPFLAKIHTEKERYTTTRVYRVFQRRENKLTLLSRTDWEQPPPNRDGKGAPEWLLPKDESQFCEFLATLGLGDEAPDAIIIKDLIKGVITDTLVKVLAEKYPKVPWFVSTKRWNPPWLNILSKVDLRLLLIPPIAANTALIEREGLDSWIAPGKPKPTRGAMKCIGDIERTICPTLHEDTAPIVAVSPKEGSILAKKGESFVVYNGVADEGAHLVGWATAFFSTLCASILERSDHPLGLDKVVDFALGFASTWAATEARYLQEPDKENSQPPKRLHFHDDPKAILSFCSEPAFWATEWKAWTDATAMHGIIVSESNKRIEKRIELWRGMTAVDGYICFEPQKRKSLSRLGATMREVARGIDEHHAVQLMAEPGSGKTHLVRCLAKASGLRMLSFNISQLNRREDIMSCFDTIVTTQASEQRQPLVVFFDEINAKINSQNVYDAFLSPLEESLYIRGGLKFHIKPCLWVFAGTVERDGREADKYVDFKSRLTLGIVQLGKMLAIEKAYLGAQLVRARFADVRRVSQDALDQFAAVPGDVRELRTLVNKLHDVQNSQVSKANFPGGTAEPNEQFVDVD